MTLFRSILVAFTMAFTLAVQAASSQAPDILKSLGIKPQIEKTYPAQFKDLDESDPRIYLMSIRLGTLKADQFNKLKTYFKNQSAVSFDPTRIYKLEDFLPPAMQAMLNKSINDMDFSSIVYPKNEDGDEDNYFFFNYGYRDVSSMVNCIGTAFEMSRVINTQNGLGQYYLYSPGRIDASTILTDKKNIQKVTEKNLKFGDLYYLGLPPSEIGDYFGEQVQHLAIFLTGNIYFEKRDSSDKDPYRLVLLEDMQSRLKKALDGEPTKTRFLRFNQSAFNLLKPVDSAREVLLDPESESYEQMKAMISILAPEIKNAILMTAMDEIGMGGGPEYAISVVDKISIAQQGDKVQAQGDVKSVQRLKPIK